MPESPFKTYREAIEQMNADATVQAARAAHREAEAALMEMLMQQEEASQPLVEAMTDARVAVEQWEGPYRAKMDDAQAAIAETVIAARQSMQESGIEAKFSPGRRTTSWQSVAMRLNPSKELIEEFTKPGTPSVAVRVL